MAEVVLVVGYKQINVCNKFGVSQSWTVGDIKNDIKSDKCLRVIYFQFADAKKKTKPLVMMAGPKIWILECQYARTTQWIRKKSAGWVAYIIKNVFKNF